MEILAAVTHEVNAAFTLESVELQPPKRGEILVRLEAAGICHTDEAARCGHLPLSFPAILGHEGAGVVAALGEGVTEFTVGDSVCLTFATCGTCDSCICGHPYACENMGKVNFMGVMDDGTKRHFQKGQPLSNFFAQSSFATYAVVNQRSAVKIDADVDKATVAAFGCGIQTGAGIVLNRLKPEFGSYLAVFGCGTVGMSAIMAAKIAGCAKIIAVGGNEASLQLAKELGATHCINRKKTENLGQELRKITGGKGLDYAIDTSGVEGMIEAAFSALRYTGVLTLAGGGTRFTVRSGLGARTIFGTSEGHSVPKVFIPRLLEYYRDGRFPVDRIITCFPFEKINEAFEASHQGKVIKAVLKINKKIE